MEPQVRAASLEGLVRGWEFSRQSHRSSASLGALSLDL